MNADNPSNGSDDCTATGTVIVPAYNESGNVGNSMRRIAETLRTALPERRWEIVVVDDGSADDTATEASAAASAIGPDIAVRVLQHPVNRGLGAALQTGIAASVGGVVVIADCDLSYHPDHIPALVQALELHSAKVALASPYMPGGSTLGVPRPIERRSRAANRFLARASGVPLHTLTGMVRAYDGPFVRQLALKSTGDVINVEALNKTQVLRGRVVEVPAVLDWRGLETRAGRTGRATRRTRTKTYQTVASGILFRPYGVFIVGGMSLIGIGGVLGLLAMLLPGSQFGLTVLGVSMMGAGVLSGFLSLLSLQVKRCFEELYFQQARVRGLVGRVVPNPLVPNPLVAESPAAPPPPAPTDRPPVRVPDGVALPVPMAPATAAGNLP